MPSGEGIVCIDAGPIFAMLGEAPKVKSVDIPQRILYPPPVIARLVPGNPDIKVSGVSRYSFYWIPAYFDPDGERGSGLYIALSLKD